MNYTHVVPSNISRTFSHTFHESLLVHLHHLLYEDYASPRIWNQLPASLSQPLTNLSNTDSPSSLSGTYSIRSIDSLLSASATPSFFHSRLKISLFYKSFPPQPSFSSPGLTPSRIPQTVYRYFWAYPFFYFFSFPLISFRFRAVD